MNPKISKLKAERAKNDGKIAMLQSRNREIDEDIIKLENEDIVGLARATGMTMEELAQYLMHIKRAVRRFAAHRRRIWKMHLKKTKKTLRMFRMIALMLSLVLVFSP